MDFLSQCRRCCLQCLPFLEVSPDSAPKVPPSPHPAELPRSSPVAPPQAQAPASANNRQASLPLQSRSDAGTGLAKLATSELGGNPAPEGVVAGPVSSSSPSSESGASPGEASTPSAGTEPPLHVLVPGISPHRRSDADENLLQEGSADIDNADTSETSVSTPVLGKEFEYREGNDSESSAMADDSTSIEAYSSESVPSEVPEDCKEEIGTNSSPSGRRRLLHRLKNPFKSISHKSRKGGLHLKEKGEKHLHTGVANMNKQASSREAPRNSTSE